MNSRPPTRPVLYAEDDEANRRIMEIAFQKAGLNGLLRTAVDGRQAIDYLSGTGPYSDRKQYPLPAVLLLDLKMPGFTGFYVLKWIRERPEFTSLPVIIFSSSCDPEDRAHARRLGANDFFEKPVAMAKWAEVVERIKPALGSGRVEAHCSRP